MKAVRERLVNAGLYVFAVLLPVTVFVSLNRILENEWQVSHLLNVLAAGIVIVVSLFSRKLPFNIKALFILGILLFYGTYSLLVFGLAGMGELALAAFSMLAAALFGMRAGFIALSSCLGILASIAFAIRLNWIAPHIPEDYLTSSPAWITALIAFALFLGLAVIGSGGIYRHLEESFEKLTGRTMELYEANQNLESEIAERIRSGKIQQVLLEIFRASNLSGGLEEFLVKIRNLLGKVLDTTNFFVALYDEARDEYTFPYMADQHDEPASFKRLQLKKSLTDYVRRTGKPLLLDEDAIKELEESGEVDMVGAPSHSWLGVPLRTPHSIIGVAAVQSYRESQHFTLADLNLLDMVSGHIALAIEHKETEEALRESEQRFRRIFEGGPLGMAVMDLNSCFIRANQVLSTMLGYSQEELSGLDLFRIVHPDEAAPTREAFQQLLNRELISFKTERRFIHKEDHQVWTDFSVTVVLSEDNRPLHILAMFEDITEQKQAEAEKKELEHQFRHAQKMQAIGLLAGGVAHDFNNILTGISWTSELALKETEPDSESQTAFQQVLELADRAAVLTRQLLAFSRQQSLNPVEVHANELIRQTLRMLERLIGENITLTFKAKASFDLIKADPGQLEQVLMNLAINARDAMPNGGSLVIETRNEKTRRESDLTFSTSKQSGAFVVIEVRDTGVGMDQDTLDRIFEPFFTTKELGKGTGLGLSTVYGIISQHGGHISADSVPGKGSTFTIIFPCLEERGIELPKSESVNVEFIPKGDEMILVVEDEESLQALISRILENEGYQVRLASSPEEVDEETAASIDLLLTDMVMPGGSGLELYDKLRSIQPDLKVIFMSGYTDQDILPDQSDIPFLQKPFSPHDLTRTIRAVLDS